jgi:hypothetical protein
LSANSLSLLKHTPKGELATLSEHDTESGDLGLEKLIAKHEESSLLGEYISDHVDFIRLHNLRLI